jgi:hypothetical protein
MLEHSCGLSIERRSSRSDAKATLATKAPINPASRQDHAGNVLVDVPVQRGPPRHKLKPQPIVDHGKALRGQGHALAMESGDVFAMSDGPVNHPVSAVSLEAVAL